MMHPFRSVVGVYEDDLDSWLGPFGQPVYSAQFMETDWARGFPRGAKWTIMPIPGPVELLQRYGEFPVEERIGPRLHAIVARGLGRAFEWSISIEDLPDEGNRVTLDPALTDSSGLPAPRIHYELSDYSHKSLAFNIERAIEAHQAAGATEIFPIDWGPQTGWHLLGTARMGTDPETSVVDPFGRAHDVPNLFIVDGSVFVTSGAANPTSTITAIALRTAQHIVQTARLQEVPA
jgi:choline dehydrogenase-like flavoprotein